MTDSAKTTDVADLSGTDTSTVIPGDDFASGGPEPPKEYEEGVDLGDFDLNEPEPEEPAEPAPDAEPEAEPEPDTPPAVQEQSPEANAAFAEMRRRAEQAQRDLAARDDWVRQRFGATHGITTWEQYQAAVENTHRQQEAARQQEMQTRPQAVFQHTYNQLIEQGYEQSLAQKVANAEAATVAQTLKIQQMEAEMAAAKHREAEAARMAQERQHQETVKQISAAITSDHAKLREEYGDLVPENLAEFAEATVDKVRRGYSLYDAWYLDNRAQVMEKQKKAAEQKALNRINSKSHLRTEGDGAGDETQVSTVPLSQDTLQAYLDSGMSERQARAFHKKLYG